MSLDSEVLNGNEEHDKVLLERVEKEEAVDWAEFHAEAWDSPSGNGLFCRMWLCPGDAKKAVVIVHGLHGHSGRYPHVAKYLTSRGFSVLAFDIEGHGRSPGPRGHFKSFDRLLDNLVSFIEFTKSKINGPVFLLGHSLGGCLALGAAQKHDVAAALISAPVLAISKPAFIRAALSIVASVAPSVEVSKLQGNLEGDQDPLMFRGGLSARVAHEILKGSNIVNQLAESFKSPLFVGHSLDDKTTNPEASQKFFERVIVEKRKLIQYDDIHVHELLCPDHHEQVLGDMCAWLESAQLI